MNVQTNSEVDSNTPASRIPQTPDANAASAGQAPVFRASRGICKLGLKTPEMSARPEGCCLPLCGLSFPSTPQLCLEICLNLRLDENREAQSIQ